MRRVPHSQVVDEAGLCRLGPVLGPPEEVKGLGEPLGDGEGLGDPDVLSDGEGLGEGVEDGAVLCLREGLGEGEGDGEAVAETGSAWHWMSVEAVA